jgi:hypothetical protein
MNWQDASIAGTTVVAGMVVLCVLIWQVFKTGQVAVSSRMSRDLQAQYQQAIADSAAAQQVTAARLAELTETVHDLRERVIAIEDILKQVE